MIAAREPRPICSTGSVMPVQSPDANRAAGRLPLELVAHGDTSGSDRAGHDRAVPGHRERAVDRHAEQAGVGGRLDRDAGRLEGRLELRQACAGDGRGPHDRRAFQKRAADERADLFFDQVEPGRIDQVALGQRDDARVESPSRERICMCSRVWGMTESSAATTSMARSSPEAPASMLRMNRSWPGTSIKAS